MKLSDIMGHAGLSAYAEVALILFFAAFLAILVRTLRWTDRTELDRVSRLPLEDDGGDARRTGGRS